MHASTELQIRLKPLARWCGVQFIHARAERIDFLNDLVLCKRVTRKTSTPSTDEHQSEVVVEDSSMEDDYAEIPYDVLSIDIGSVTKVPVLLGSKQPFAYQLHHHRDWTKFQA